VLNLDGSNLMILAIVAFALLFIVRVRSAHRSESPSGLKRPDARRASE
jgi:hypothetical protein